MITIIIPTLNEEKYIYDLLGSISSYPSISEILVIDGQSKDKTREKIELFKSNIKKKNLNIYIIDNPDLLQSYALNIGIKNAKNKLVIRIDAHSIISNFKDKDFFLDISKKISTNKYSMIGFKQRFIFKTIFEASLFVLSFTYFLSKSSYRYTNKEIASYDTAWLFAIKKEDAKSVNYINTEAIINEDYDFCQRLINYKKKPILIYPEFPIYYLPRPNIIALAQQYYKYGYGRVQTEYRLDRINSSLVDLILYIFTLIFIVAFFIMTLSNLKFFLLILFINFTCTIYQLRIDTLGFSRRNLLSKNLIIGILISPFIAPIPFFFRTIGKAKYIIKNLFK